MNSLACGSTADGQYIIKNFIAPFMSHSQQYIYNWKMFLLTFAGQQCSFGRGTPRQELWNAWPKTNAENTQWADDAWWMQNAAGKGSLTHPPGGDPSVNNRHFRGKNFGYHACWQQLIANRNSLPCVEVATWNDDGESHYWTNGWSCAGRRQLYYLTTTKATWWKSSAAPTIATDHVYILPQVNRPNLLLLGLDNSGTRTLNAGVNEFTVPLAAGGVGCTVTRNGANLIGYVPSEFTYSTSPSVCNMNAWAGLARGQRSEVLDGCIIL
ncbi:hypothetical protein FRC08_014664 [Ceratobasidium sp. 394]|nr:hypothetical protein FRC08_014664 [Ceratobasidium sp. 394]